MKELITRPQLLKDFVGKTNIKLSLDTYIQSAKMRKQNLDHIIFYGSPGVGKTSLATIIANELNTNIHYVQGPSINKISDVIDMVSLIKENDVIFIDEIHQVNVKCLEIFYSILEDFVADIKIGKDFNSQYTRLQLPKFTLIASTTNFGKLPTPFIDRFGIKLFIDLYNESEIFQIIERICKLNNLNINEQNKKRIASYSKGTPRIAINLTNRFYDYQLINENMSADDIFNAIGIYKYGLNKVDINYLKILTTNYKPIGIRSIAQQLYLDSLTIEFTIEPYLLILGFICKNNLGRQITDKGRNYLKNL
ncbi:MAG: Holliday junction branch migration DNA helicase RuvB [Ureaplasma sp.]|nr:Holliday junction branch migration DNA helicase RuvB [Ureaplasma sp.]